jgi:uncharacterized protein YuzE
MATGKRWMVRDRYGNQIYLTQERWEHIIEPLNHPEMADYEEHLKEVLRSGHRKQDSRSPQKYRYSHPFAYDEESDTLYIAFAPGEHATGIELTDHILFRINTREHRAVGVTLFDYSILAQQTDMGPRSFPLIGIDRLPPALRDLVFELLRQPPVRDILALSAYTPTLTETTPIIAVQPLTLAASTP